MPTLKKLNEDRIKITSKLLKKDEDFLPVSPELIKDLRDRTLFATPSMRLSFAQYDTMCKDEKVLNMMSVALNKPKAKLKKFCKYLSVFKQNIYLSPKKLTAKITETDIQDKPIFKLPKELRTAILDKFSQILPTKYVLLDWIDKAKLNWTFLSRNPNAIDLLKENISKSNIHWKFISSNPNAIDLLLDNKHKIHWDELCNNPSAIDLIKERIEYENSLTTKEYNDLDLEDKINWNNLSANPNAIDLLKKNYDKINWVELSANPNAIDLLKKNYDKINWVELSKNPNAIDLLKKNYDKINWFYLGKNPGAIDLIKERIKYENSLTKEQYNNLVYYKDRLNWSYLSENPNAIKLLKKNPNKIDWFNLSANPNAIDLLKENTYMINWNELSSNPNAIDLLEERIKYEKSLTNEELDELENKIYWLYLSKNLNAIDLLKKNKEEIEWAWFSLNPAIFKAV